MSDSARGPYNSCTYELTRFLSIYIGFFCSNMCPYVYLPDRIQLIDEAGRGLLMMEGRWTTTIYHGFSLRGGSGRRGIISSLLFFSLPISIF